MSVIGPRPALWNQDVLIAEREKYHANDVKPGLTGWAQINGRDELEIPVKAKLDGEYVEKESLLFDIKCFLGTIGSVLSSDGVVEGGTGELTKAGIGDEREISPEKAAQQIKAGAKVMGALSAAMLGMAGIVSWIFFRKDTTKSDKKKHTDKAAYPVNAMGTSKAMMEKVIVAKSRTVDPEKTKICCTRYGNVMCSRGSVIPLWIEQIKAGNPITITEPSMTRFIMSLEEAVDLVLFAFENGTSGDILVQKAPACTIEVLAKAVTELFAPGHEIKVIGIRHGEKMYETLLTNEECANAIDMGEFYRVPCDKRDLNYDKYFKEGDVERNILTEFNSSNTELLDVEQVKEKLLTLQYIRDELAEWENR